MMLTYFQKGFNYGQDGPGNRLVIHLQGCNMHCPWCSNPEGMPLCDGETECSGGKIHKVSGESLVEEIVSCETLFFDGGGVTFTGGEATLQFDGLREVLAALKEKKIHTAIETNGTHAELEALFPLLDLLIMDIKQVDEAVHKEVTGVSNKRILENIRKAVGKHPNVLLRIPLIRGFNASEADLQRFVSFAKELLTPAPEGTVRFEFLPYHEYGKVKWEACGRPYTVKDGFISEKTRAMFQQAFRENKIPLIQT